MNSAEKQSMAVRDVIHVPHPTLREKAEKVTSFDESLAELIDDMVETMRHESGAGLAAPQINISKRIIVVEFGSKEDESIPPTLYTVVNPEITRFSQELVTGAEGCLSIPGLMGEVERSRSITIQGKTRSGDPFKMKAEGWLARVFQHEVDHLNGVLYTDHATEVWNTEETYDPV